MALVTAELALQTQSLSILLLPKKTDVKNVKPEDLDGDADENIVELRSLSLGNECELQPERVEEGRLGFAALELLNDTPDEREVPFFHYHIGCHIDRPICYSPLS
jgi:hypothetical protein